MNTKFEFPIRINLSQFKNKTKLEVRKLFRFFRYIENYQYGKIDTMDRREYVLIRIRDSRIIIDEDGDLEIRAVGLKIKIYIDRTRREITIIGDANAYEFEIFIRGTIEAKTKDNNVLLKITPESIPEIHVY